MSSQVPLVSYLTLGNPPRLTARECRQCGARFFDRRNACASCGGQAGFDDAVLPGEGALRTFTIVSVAAPGVPVPYVAGVIDLGGTSVRANLVNVKPDPDALALGMRAGCARSAWERTPMASKRSASASSQPPPPTRESRNAGDRMDSRCPHDEVRQAP